MPTDAGKHTKNNLEREHLRPPHMRAGNCPTCGNPWEKAGREGKIRRLVEAIDVELGYVALSHAAEAVADQLEAWPLEAWVQLAVKARVLGPSSVTIGEVIRVYRERGDTRGKL